MLNSKRNINQNKKNKFDKKQCTPGVNDILDNKEQCKTIKNKDCGKKVYVENGNYFYCRNYTPLFGKRGCDYLSTNNKKQGICSNQKLINEVLSKIRETSSIELPSSSNNKFTTKTKSELVSRLSELKKLGYNQKIFDEVLSPLADNATFLTPKQRVNLKSQLQLDAIQQELTNKKIQKELKRLDDKDFELDIRKRLQTLKQGGKKKRKSRKHKSRKN